MLFFLRERGSNRLNVAQKGMVLFISLIFCGIVATAFRQPVFSSQRSNMNVCVFSNTGQRSFHSRRIAGRSTLWTKLFSASTTQSDEETIEVGPSLSSPTPNGGQQDTETIPAETPSKKPQQLRRVLGSQELLMLPRQYRPKETGITFPPMTHVSVVTLNATPSISHLRAAIDTVLQVHPLLSCRVEGDGEPDKRIDLFQMVRSGNPNPETFVVDEDCAFDSNDVLKVENIPGDTTLEDSWSKSFQYNLDHAAFDTSRGPLWSLELHKFGDEESASDQPCALLLTFNHAISDQSSANLLMDHIIADIASLEHDGTMSAALKNSIPKSMEECTLGTGRTFADIGGADLLSLETIQYVAGKAAEGLKNAPILPDDVQPNKTKDALDLGALTTISGRSAGGQSKAASERESMVEHRTLSADVTTALLKKCRENGVTISNALTAAMVYTSSDFIGSPAAVVEGEAAPIAKSRNYKVLQSLDFRRFGAEPDPCETVGCHAGSHDLLLGPISDLSGRYLRTAGKKDSKARKEFWNVACVSRDQTKEFVESGGPSNAVRVFDAAMSFSDMNNLVHLTAQSEASQGRAYSAGVTNVGVYEKQAAVRRNGEKKRSNLKTKHGRYEIQDIFFATSHARSGSLYQVSLLTVNGEAKLTFHPVSPIVSRETSKLFADAFVDLLKTVVVEDEGAKAIEVALTSLKDNGLSLAAAGAGVYGLAVHSDAWSQFFSSLVKMKEATPDPQGFWDALNLWIFFAVGHPILQPILWISDVLHGSPGPMVADLVPITFLAANVVFIGATLISKQLRSALNIAALSAFLAYVGAGLDGQAGLGDYNLQLDDSYKGQIVKGCPAYEDLRQPSMADFDLLKYQGKWYEHKFHDWTQFKEVYDISFDIKLTPDGTGWVDDFSVKGPAPKAAQLSWDKSPVANGAHYFMFGRVDKQDPPGVLRESGFNVEFPNYIVDVLKDPATGEYKEAIQFQCLERGGVRVFEGINFLSRSPEMTEEQLKAMHERAAKAGMNPYGASEEQMHRVEMRPVGTPDVDNAWQAMWRAIGVDKLLELLTESIEDGGREST